MDRVDLPPGIKFSSDSGVKGYTVVGHILLSVNKKVDFTSAAVLVDQDVTILPRLLARCMFYLSYLDECAVMGMTPCCRSDVMSEFVY